MREEASTAAKQFTRKTPVGVLSTVSKNLPGYPFGSVTPFMTDNEGRVIMFISDIAQHSRNLLENSKASITIYNQIDNGDQNENARVTLVGDVKKLSRDEQSEILPEYIAQFPAAATYQQAHDFHLWRMDIIRVRYIGGFGKIFWIEQEEWAQPHKPWTKEQEQGVITHMNEDHIDAMTLMLKEECDVVCDSPMMTNVLTDGCYIRAKGQRVFIPFANVCNTLGDIRKELVALTHKARKAA